VSNKCIVCTIINQAAQRIQHNGAIKRREETASHKAQNYERHMDLYLINTQHATAIGFKTLSHIDYSQDVFNIHDTHMYQLDDVLSINKVYAIELVGTTWTVIRRTPLPSVLSSVDQ
jgi:hypothetical protein